MPIDSTGDIQDRHEVTPDFGDGIDTWYDLIQEIVESRGGVHVYYANHRDRDGAHDDIHIDEDKCYFIDGFEDGSGLIFVQDGDVQRWLDPAKVLFVEKHT